MVVEGVGSPSSKSDATDILLNVRLAWFVVVESF
jgi:hypothetical protein